MNKGFVFTLGVAIGATAGYLTAWKILKTKYEQVAHEEIEEVREYYASKKDAPVSEDDSSEDSEDETESSEIPVGSLRTEYSSLASLYSVNDNEGGDKPMSRREPYIISPAEFGEDDDYETITLIYYNDGILADRDGNVIEDIESCIGYESLKHFGELSDDDSVYVRNDDSMIEYEVLLDESNYEDLEGTI